MLGKRYIGVIDRQDGAVFEWLDATTAYDMSLTVDLDRLPRADATDQDLVRHHREQAKYHAEEAARLTRDDVDSRQAAFEWHESRQSWHAERTLRLETACSTVKVERTDDREKMRDVIEAMRPIVDAAIEWLNGPYQAGKGRSGPDDRLISALGVHRDRVGAALSAWQDSQTWSEAEKLRRENERMRAVVEAAIVLCGDGGSSWFRRESQPGRQLFEAVDAYRKERP